MYFILPHLATINVCGCVFLTQSREERKIEAIERTFERIEQLQNRRLSGSEIPTQVSRTKRAHANITSVFTSLIDTQVVHADSILLTPFVRSGWGR